MTRTDSRTGNTLRDLPLVSARQRAFLDQLLATGGLTVADAVRMTGASGATVRRDFGALARRGLADRVHGGMVAPWLPSNRYLPKPSSELVPEPSGQDHFANEPSPR